MRVVPVFATFVEGAVGAEEEDEGERVALVLFGYMRHAGVDTPAIIDRVIYLRAVGCDIVRCGLGDMVVKTEMSPHVVVGFAELVVCKEFAERGVERADGLLKRCGVIEEDVLVLVQTICDGDGGMRFLPASGVVARNEEQAEEQICKMTNRLHNKRY